MEVVNYVAGRVVDSLFGVARKEISYMWNSSEYVKTLKEEVEKLKAMKETLQQRMDVAKDNGEDPGKDLENWMKNANIKISEATKLINEEDESKKTCCSLRFCVNLGNLYRYGKMATKETASLLKQQEDGERFENCVFNPLPTPGFIDLHQPIDFENIDTQKSTLKTIIQAVKDRQIVGIVGLGGVGKTTLAKEVYAKMKNQFDYIEFIVVSHDLVKEKIKQKVQAAAKKIIKGEKVLIILDDVWEELKLDEVGIPCGSRYLNCKILLTSRIKDACEAMNAKIINLNPLKEKEAWALFERVVGEREWDDALKRVALDIVKECDGLPLFIQPVAKALKNKGFNSWEATLYRLQDQTDEDDDYKRKGLMQLKLSYDYLESEVAKSCFLLCSLFPEDETIRLNNLTYYVFALRIFNNSDLNIQKAKHKVQGVVDSLKSAFLLLPEGNEEKGFKMHDLVRDMAILITSKGNDKFLVQTGKGLLEWKPKTRLQNYNKISLIRNQIHKLPNQKILFPHLDTFLIQNNKVSIVPDEFFQGMEKLKVLDMSYNRISSLPQSLKQLRELVMLDLSENGSLVEICILGELTCLEILKLRETGITNIPKEIDQLTNLRLLDVFFCRNLSYVTTGVISKLIWLEELYFYMKKGNCNFLAELSELKSLKILHLIVRDLDCIPEDFQYDTLIEFYISNSYYWSVKHHHKRMLHIFNLSPPFKMQVMKLIRLCEILSLSAINYLDNILPDLYREGFDELKYIDLRKCDNVRRLVKTCDLDALQICVTSNELCQGKTKGKLFSRVEEINLEDLNRLEVLWDSPHQYISFCNLRIIDITDCSSLLELFPVSVAQGLVNLRELNIRNCKSLVVVVSAEAEQRGGSEIEMVNQDPDIVFPLTYIYLQSLPKLESFYSGRSIIKYPSLKLIEAYNCPSMKRWSYGDNHIPNIKFEHERRQCNNINDYIAIRHEAKEDWRISEEGYREETPVQGSKLVAVEVNA